MKTFDELWRYIISRRDGVVQDRVELEYVYNLMRDCKPETYLEIGTAEGDSLLVLGSLLPSHGLLKLIDLCEPHTQILKKDSLEKLACIYMVVASDSTLMSVPVTSSETWDVVFIDGGHDYTTVLSDSIRFAPLAKKYVFWHDLQMKEVRAAYEWFKARYPLGVYSEFINSEHYGYGICKIIRD